MSERADARPAGVRIEQLGPGDAERLRSIRLRALRDAPEAFETTWEAAAGLPAESWEHQLARLATFVAAVDGRDRGLVRGAPHDEFEDAGYLISMWVAPEARRRGVGAALVRQVVEWARDRGSRRLVLDVGETNPSAISLYTSLGFVRVGERGSFPSPREHIREVRMEMTL